MTCSKRKSQVAPVLRLKTNAVLDTLQSRVIFVFLLIIIIFSVEKSFCFWSRKSTNEHLIF